MDLLYKVNYWARECAEPVLKSSCLQNTIFRYEILLV